MLLVFCSNFLFFYLILNTWGCNNFYFMLHNENIWGKKTKDNCISHLLSAAGWTYFALSPAFHNKVLATSCEFLFLLKQSWNDLSSPTLWICICSCKKKKTSYLCFPSGTILNGDWRGELLDGPTRRGTNHSDDTHCQEALLPPSSITLPSHPSQPSPTPP